MFAFSDYVSIGPSSPAFLSLDVRSFVVPIPFSFDLDKNFFLSSHFLLLAVSSYFSNLTLSYSQIFKPLPWGESFSPLKVC